MKHKNQTLQGEMNLLQKTKNAPRIFTITKVAFLIAAIFATGCKKDLSDAPVEAAAALQAKSLAGKVSATPDFTVVLLPDIQFTTDPGPEGGVDTMLTEEIKWIKNNRVAENIVYVGGLGDISDSGDQSWSDPQWTVAKNNFYGTAAGGSGLETAYTDAYGVSYPTGIPYGLSVGNHDQRNSSGVEGPTQAAAKYNAKFGISHFSGRWYYGGSYSGSNNNSHWQRFTVGTGTDKMSFLVFHLNYDLNYDVPAVTDWAYNIINNNPGWRAIVVTHYMCENGAAPSPWSTQGAGIYNKLKVLPNVFMLAGGHITGEGQRQDTYHDHTIRTYQTDYQGYARGGEGYMRIMKFSPSANTVSVKSYSPYREVRGTAPFYYTDANSQFTHPFLTPAPPVFSLANGTYRIWNRNSGFKLAINSNSTAADARVLQVNNDSAPSRFWAFEQTATPGYYKIKNTNSNLYLTVKGASFAEGSSAQVVQAAFTSGTPVNDEWALIPTTGGYYRIVARHSGLGLGMEGGSILHAGFCDQYEWASGATVAASKEFLIAP